MRYVAAYLLAGLSNNKEPPKNGDIEKILSSVGIECDSEKLNLVVNQLKGKSIDELIEEGKQKLASMPAGGGVAVAAAAPAGAAPAAAAAAPEKKEEKKQEKEESEASDDDMGFGLFD